MDVPLFPDAHLPQQRPLHLVSPRLPEHQYLPLDEPLLPEYQHWVEQQRLACLRLQHLGLVDS